MITIYWSVIADYLKLVCSICQQKRGFIQNSFFTWFSVWFS